MEVAIELLENKKKFLVFERKVAWNIILVKNFWSILFARGKSINARSNKLFQYLAWFSIKTYIYSFLSSFLSFLLFFNTNTEFKWNFLLLFSQNDKKNIYIMNDIFRRNSIRIKKKFKVHVCETFVFSSCKQVNTALETPVYRQSTKTNWPNDE